MIANIVPQTGFGMTATQIECEGISDDLCTKAVFAWSVKTDTGAVVKHGRSTIEGDDYQSWDGMNPTPVEICAIDADVEIVYEEDAEEVPNEMSAAPTP